MARVEKETRKNLKCLRSARGGEFISNKFNIICNDRPIKRQMSAPRTPPQNGIAERRNRSIMDYARKLMMKKNVSHKYWREAVSTTIYTLNWVQVKKGTNVTPFELWYGYAYNVRYFNVFGGKCYLLKDNINKKIDAKSDEGIFLGYSTKSKAYKCLNSNTNKVVESVNVKVDEYAKKSEIECKTKPEDNSTFIWM